MSAVCRGGNGAPLVASSRLAPPWTLLAVCGRDRAHLVAPALRSIRDAWPAQGVLFHRDPADVELRGLDLKALGASWVRELDIAPEVPGRERVARMRSAAALFALERGYQRVLFLDSDILVDPGAAAELDRLWALRPTEDAAVALTRCSVYDSQDYVRRDQPPLRAATIRTHGLGMALAFPCSAALQIAAQNPHHVGSWDSHWCGAVSRGVVVTPELSWAIHEGRSSGLCMQHGHPGLDVTHPTPQLEGIIRGIRAAQRGAGSENL